MKFNTQKYAEAEIELSKQALEKDQSNIQQKERLVYWSAYLGDFKTANSFAETDKSKDIIKKFDGK